MNSKPITILLKDFKESLFEIFAFYGTSNSSSPSKRSPVAKKNNMTNFLTFSHFSKLLLDFDLSKSRLISNMDVADVFLSALTTSRVGDIFITTPSIPSKYPAVINFDQFLEALVRLSFIAFAQSVSSPLNKVKAFFVKIYQKIEFNKQISNDHSAIIKGCVLFHAQVSEMWKKDKYRDYLVEEAEMEESALNVIRQMG